MTLATGNQMKAARALVGVEQAELANSAGVAVNTIRRMEGSGTDPIRGNAETVRRVQASLESSGVEFLNHGRPGVRLREPGE